MSKRLSTTGESSCGLVVAKQGKTNWFAVQAARGWKKSRRWLKRNNFQMIYSLGNILIQTFHDGSVAENSTFVIIVTRGWRWFDDKYCVPSLPPQKDKAPCVDVAELGVNTRFCQGTGRTSSQSSSTSSSSSFHFIHSPGTAEENYFFRNVLLRNDRLRTICHVVVVKVVKNLISFWCVG